MEHREEIAAVLGRIGIDAEPLEIEPLTGGVSSNVFRVDLPGRSVCVKFALDRLKVAEPWFAPRRRGIAEYRWLSFVGARLPDHVPQLLGYDAEHHAIVMAFLSPDNPTWKARLLAGASDAGFAAAVGARLTEIHAYSAAAGVAEDFANMADFELLRLEPYLRFTASRHPDLAATLEALADEQAGARIALVHGDVSPKNILCSSDGPIFLDAECATFGDPAFDVAFCLNHLLIKALAFPDLAERHRTSARALWASYRQGITWEPVVGLERRMLLLIPALMLARVDGKSPLEYLTPESADIVRRTALAMLEGSDALQIALEMTGERLA